VSCTGSLFILATKSLGVLLG